MADYIPPDPLLSGRFWIELQGIVEGSFTECSGLIAETEVQEYAEGGLNDYVHKLPVRTKYSNITLKRGFVGTTALWDWYRKIINGVIEPADISIIVSENTVGSPGKERGRWNLHQAYPVKWQGPELRADGGAAMVETLELAHRGWDYAAAR
ncbi:MAG TPA: phage tail protein [Chloroflexota bacterium]|nr:phage tail protein [Chloroflexota bacterium]